MSFAIWSSPDSFELPEHAKHFCEMIAQHVITNTTPARKPRIHAYRLSAKDGPVIDLLWTNGPIHDGRGYTVAFSEVKDASRIEFNHTNITVGYSHIEVEVAYATDAIILAQAVIDAVERMTGPKR